MKNRQANRWTVRIVLVAALWGMKWTRAEEAAPSAFFVDGLAVDESPLIGGEALSSSRALSLRDSRPPPLMSPITGPEIRPAGTAPMVAPRGEALQFLRLAELAAARQEWASALRAIQQGVWLEPHNTLLLTRGAALAALNRDYNLADDYYRRLLALFPDNLAYLNGRAAVLLRLRRLSEAQRLLDRAASIHPQDLMTRFNRACLRIARGDGGDDPSWEQLQTGELLMVTNWLDADRGEFEAVLGREGYARLCEILVGPGSAEKVRSLVPLLTRAMRAGAAGEWEQAARALREAKEMGLPAMGLDMSLAQALFEQGQRDEARALMQQLAERYPGHVEVLYNYAYILIQENAFEQALAVLERAQAAAPNHALVTFARACMLAETGRIEEAWPLLTHLIRAQPAETRTWLQGDYPYLRRIQADPRYAHLLAPPVAEPR